MDKETVMKEAVSATAAKFIARCTSHNVYTRFLVFYGWGYMGY
jgi:hypothetical protein